MRKPADLHGFNFVLGASFATILFGCAGAVFPYKYYGVRLVTYEGSLLGPTESEDLSAKVCTPTESDASPCTAMLTKDFEFLKLDYMDTQQKLIQCEGPK